MKKIILSAMTLLTGCLAGCGQQEFKSVDADEFEKAISTNNVQLVDVRTAEEFAEGHIGADATKNIDVKRPDFIEQAEQELDKGKTVAVYCRSGRRSADAAKQLAERGFKVIDLKGGIIGWRQHGKPTRQ